MLELNMLRTDASICHQETMQLVLEQAPELVQVLLQLEELEHFQLPEPELHGLELLRRNRWCHSQSCCHMRCNRHSLKSERCMAGKRRSLTPEHSSGMCCMSCSLELGHCKSDMNHSSMPKHSCGWRDHSAV